MLNSEELKFDICFHFDMNLEIIIGEKNFQVISKWSEIYAVQAEALLHRADRVLRKLLRKLLPDLQCDGVALHPLLQ